MHGGAGLSKNREMAEAEVYAKTQMPAGSYEEVYAAMNQTWEKYAYQNIGNVNRGEAQKQQSTDAVYEVAAEEEVVTDLGSPAHGATNLRTEAVEEADIIKNDGRYLYQIVRGEENGTWKEAIQILDTQDGLTEVTRVEGFQAIEEFFVWEDSLIVVENKQLSSARYMGSAKYEACYDVAWEDKSYHGISFYDISDRAKPRKQKTFTLDGSYLTSRISDGYFYGISRYHASPGNGERDYDSYIPMADGVRLAAKQICLPEGTRGTSYLVLVSVDLKNPFGFTDTRAVVFGGELFYVSNCYLYAGEYQMPQEQEGRVTDETQLLKFSYEKGKFFLKVRGSVPGMLDSSFSLDEYRGKLRAVSTVREYDRKKIVDERTGKELGYDDERISQTNALYVLDENLKQMGAIEHLAENEQIYSARFLKDTAYFVTFRQTDPLFAVDLSEPSKPKLLGELKVSGFSEYLHFYGEDLLLGIGMEADEETGRQQGMKLSMFDISDPAELREVARYRMKDYNYSEALYNYRAVLIHTDENIIGFPAEGSSRDGYRLNYLVYAYEDGEFIQKLKLDGKDDAKGICRIRGTFIGDTFYLLRQDGSAEAYDRKTGIKIQELKEGSR